jgi:predicted DNA-binding transcriptional regulator AlpA
MMEFEFTLKFMLGASGPNIDELIEHLGAAGCNDALVGIGQTGRIALDFSREADSAKQAIISALADVKRAIPDAKFLEATPDFVGLTEVAELVGVTRQNMRKLAVAHKDSFPVAVHEGNAAIWHLSPILQWLKGHVHYSIPQSLLDVAHFAMQINLAKEASQIEQRVHRKVMELVA